MTDTAPQTPRHQAVGAPQTAVGIVPQEDKSIAPTQSRVRDKQPNAPPKATVAKMNNITMQGKEQTEVRRVSRHSLPTAPKPTYKNRSASSYFTLGSPQMNRDAPPGISCKI